MSYNNFFRRRCGKPIMDYMIFFCIFPTRYEIKKFMQEAESVAYGLFTEERLNKTFWRNDYMNLL
jgi:hypothetical protein